MSQYRKGLRKPNLQNIPIRSDLGKRIRRAFIADKVGQVSVFVDFSQMELQILLRAMKGTKHE